jgi:hypothetical protein
MFVPHLFTLQCTAVLKSIHHDYAQGAAASSREGAAGAALVAAAAMAAMEMAAMEVMARVTPTTDMGTTATAATHTWATAAVATETAMRRAGAGLRLQAERLQALPWCL